MVQKGSKKPIVFDYDDYRVFLKDTYLYEKGSESKFSFREFSKRGGFVAPNVLKIVMDGQRNLTSTSIAKFSKALKFKRSEADFFESLVRFNQAKKDEDRTLYLSKMHQNRMYRKHKKIELNEFRFFSNWHYALMREIVNLKNFDPQPSKIAERLRFSVSESEIETTIKDLLQLGFLRRDERGKFINSSPTLSSGEGVKAIAIKNLHRSLIQLGERSLHRVPRSQRDISTVTLPIKAQDYDAIKKDISEFRKGLMTRYGSERGTADEIYQLCIQFFPMTKPIE